jgi:hypothetical protein
MPEVQFPAAPASDMSEIKNPTSVKLSRKSFLMRGRTSMNTPIYQWLTK